MRLYQKLSGISFLRNSYTLKFLFIAFIGIHIPLIGILFFVLYSERMASPNAILVFALIMTLIATGATLYILKKLIRPIELASRALDDYRSTRRLTDLPSDYSDEAGLLMRNIHESIRKHEDFIIEKQDLLYLLSHDLKTFTGNTQSLSKLLLEEANAEETKEYAELIYQSSTQQMHFIENFIRLIKEQDDISKSDSDVLRVIDFTKVIGEVERNVAQQLSIKNIRLKSNISVAEAELYITEELLVRVLVNLVDNAVKFSFPDNEINIHVYAQPGKILLSVADHGVGFDPSQKEEIFRKFTKGKLGTANESSTGIGLYLSKKIAEKHDGNLLAESKGNNHGAVFTVVFRSSSKAF